MKRTPVETTSNTGLIIEKDGEKNRFVLMKNRDDYFYINIGNRRSVQGMIFNKEELLRLAWEIENIASYGGRHIVVRGYWKEEPEKIFEEECMIGDFRMVSRVCEEDYIYLWFEDETKIIGDHGNYVVLEYWLGKTRP